MSVTVTIEAARAPATGADARGAAPGIGIGIGIGTATERRDQVLVPSPLGGEGVPAASGVSHWEKSTPLGGDLCPCYW